MNKKYKIMVIDNNEDFSYSLLKFIKSNIKWVSDAKAITNNVENLDTVIEFNPDIILCNNINPILSSRNDIIKKANVFIISGDLKYEMIKHYNDLEVKKEMQKPIRINKIFNIIEEQLTNKQSTPKC